MDRHVTFIGHDRRRRGAGAGRSSAGCAPASACAPTSPRSCATTCGSASSCTSPSRSRARTRVRLPARLRARRGRRHAALRRRPPRHARRRARRRRSTPTCASPRDDARRRAALARRAGRPRRCWRGDELARELRHRARPAARASCWRSSPRASYAGEIATRAAGARARPRRVARATSGWRAYHGSLDERPELHLLQDRRRRAARERSSTKTSARSSFMDINPATRGHALVIPRRHARDLLSVEPDDLAAVARRRAAPRRRAICERLGRRRGEPAQLLRRGRLADRLPLPRPRDPALRRAIRCACRGRRRPAIRARSRPPRRNSAAEWRTRSA